MGPSAQRLLARIGRWPRRIAALCCLLLAAASALLPQPSASGGATSSGTLSTRLRAGEVAVAVPVPADSVTGLRSGDRVGVLAAMDSTLSTATAPAASATLVADRLRVLRVATGTAGLAEASAVVTVATDRAHAVLLARFADRSFTLIVDDPAGSHS